MQQFLLLVEHVHVYIHIRHSCFHGGRSWVNTALSPALFVDTIYTGRLTPRAEASSARPFIVASGLSQLTVYARSLHLPSVARSGRRNGFG